MDEIICKCGHKATEHDSGWNGCLGDVETCECMLSQYKVAEVEIVAGHKELYKLANILIQFDTNQECPYCQKRKWGNDRHDDSCPFANAYKILSGEDDNE
jgi:hypothetical protein